MSIPTIRPCSIEKSHATFGRPPGAHASPTAPATSAGCAPRARPENVSATAVAPRRVSDAPIRTGRGVGFEHHVRVEERHQCVEVGVAGRGDERVDDLTLTGEIAWRGRRDPAASGLGVLARRDGGAAHDDRDHSKGTSNVTWSTNASRSARVSVSSTRSDRGAQRVGQRRLVLGARGRLAVGDRVGEGRVDGILPACSPGAQHVQAHAGDTSTTSNRRSSDCSRERAEPDQAISDVGGGQLTALVKDGDGNVIGLIQST